MNRIYAVALALALPAAGARAQVGYLPERSPFRDLEYRQELSLLSGYLVASKDPVGVAPRSAPMAGLRYEVRLGGPAQLVVRGVRVFSNRTVIDPIKSGADRVRGDESAPFYLADAGISLNLTGQKSFHGLVPVVNAGLGVASDLSAKQDVGEFKLGTSFAISFGGGVRWVPGGKFQLRADVNDHLYQIAYPQLYYHLPTGGGAPVLAEGAPNSFWKHNAALTVGLSYLFFR